MDECKKKNTYLVKKLLFELKNKQKFENPTPVYTVMLKDKTMVYKLIYIPSIMMINKITTTSY